MLLLGGCPPEGGGDRLAHAHRGAVYDRGDGLGRRPTGRSSNVLELRERSGGVCPGRLESGGSAIMSECSVCGVLTSCWENGYEPSRAAFFKFIRDGVTGPYYCLYCWNRRPVVDTFDAPL